MKNKKPQHDSLEGFGIKEKLFIIILFYFFHNYFNQKPPSDCPQNLNFSIFQHQILHCICYVELNAESAFLNCPMLLTYQNCCEGLIRQQVFPFCPLWNLIGVIERKASLTKISFWSESRCLNLQQYPQFGEARGSHRLCLLQGFSGLCLPSLYHT